MALATYKDICIDAVDPARMGKFWSGVLGLELDQRGVDQAQLTGPTKQHTVWLNPVPEAKSVKHRVHIDVNASSVEEVVALGGTVVDDRSFPWTVMKDPEDGEFCVFTREGEIAQRLYELVVERGFSYIDQVQLAPFDSICFIPVPEPKTIKNRIHIDVATPDVGALVTAGASVVRPPDDEIDWHVLADPEGNEFCAFVRPVVSDR